MIAYVGCIYNHPFVDNLSLTTVGVSRPHLVTSDGFPVWGTTAGVTYQGHDNKHMEWFNGPWFEAPAFITLAVIAAGALRWAWRNLIKPGWELMKAAVHLAEIHATVDQSLPILKELNAQFTTNGGSSLHDRIVNLETHADVERRERQKIGEDVTEIRSMVSAFIVTRQPGGKRATD